MVLQPMVVKSKLAAGRRATSWSQPPTRMMQIGSSTNIRPTVLITNCTMSVSVSDHMPPTAE